MIPRIQILSVGAAILLCACSDAATPLAPNERGAPSPQVAASHGIAPPRSSPGGRPYAEWSAAWWQWALETPASLTPLLDPTGERCAEGQRGHVWFLAGSLGGDPVSRECTVPTGTALFFPLINLAYFAFLNDPPESRTEEFIRGQVACISDATFPQVDIDGVPVAQPEKYLVRSTIFTIVLPEDNVFGATEADIPELTLSPVADEGFYLFISPRTPGEHTIRWRAQSASCGFGQDITYHLTVR